MERRDPYHTKSRRSPRGYSQRHPQRRAFYDRVVLPRMQGLQAMEIALRAAGVPWRQFMKAVYAEDGAAIARYRGMVADAAT